MDCIVHTVYVLYISYFTPSHTTITEHEAFYWIGMFIFFIAVADKQISHALVVAHCTSTYTFIATLLESCEQLADSLKFK